MTISISRRSLAKGAAWAAPAVAASASVPAYAASAAGCGPNTGSATDSSATFVYNNADEGTFVHLADGEFTGIISDTSAGDWIIVDTSIAQLAPGAAESGEVTFEIKPFEGKITATLIMTGTDGQTCFADATMTDIPQ